MLGSNTYRLVGEGGQVEEIVAADQLKPYHTESSSSAELTGIQFCERNMNLSTHG